MEEALRKLTIEKQAAYFDKPNYRSDVVFQSSGTFVRSLVSEDTRAPFRNAFTLSMCSLPPS